MITFSISAIIPKDLQIDMKQFNIKNQDLVARVGSRISTEIRSAIRRGEKYGGGTLPGKGGKDGRKLREDTDQLLKSIKGEKRKRSRRNLVFKAIKITPSGPRTDTKLKNNNLLAVLCYTDLDDMDPFGFDANESFIRSRIRELAVDQANKIIKQKQDRLLKAKGTTVLKK